MSPKEKLEYVMDLCATLNDEVVSCEGFDDCIMGIAVGQHNKAVLVYDRDRIIQKLMFKDGMSRDEAIEFFEFNISGAFVGDSTPLYVTSIKTIFDHVERIEYDEEA